MTLSIDPFLPRPDETVLAEHFERPLENLQDILRLEVSPAPELVDIMSTPDESLTAVWITIGPEQQTLIPIPVLATVLMISVESHTQDLRIEALSEGRWILISPLNSVSIGHKRIYVNSLVSKDFQGSGPFVTGDQVILRSNVQVRIRLVWS